MNNYATYTDEQLLALLKQADEVAFTTIYYRYREQLLQYALQIVDNNADAIEVVHDVLLAIWNKKASLEILHLGKYLFSSTRHGSLKKLSGKTKIISLAVIPQKALEQWHLTDPVMSGEANSIQENIEAQLEKAIGEMPDRMRSVYELRQSSSLSHREIGQRLHITEETSKKHFKNALRHLRVQLANLLPSVLLVLCS